MISRTAAAMLMALCPAVALAQAPPTYAAPLTLRPAIAPNVVRFDNMIDASAEGVVYVPLLTVAVRVIPELSPMVRLGMATFAPSEDGDHSVFVNPLIGALYAPDVGHGLRPAFFAGVALPLGSGEGSPPSPSDNRALAYGRRARLSLDNALFATNYTTLSAGVGLAWIYEVVTLQLDLTLLHSIGSRDPVRDPYDDATNLIASMWVGVVFLPWLHAGVELRHQHFLDEPIAIRTADGPPQEVQTTVGAGMRFRIPIEGSVVLPLGLSYNVGLDGWMFARSHHVVQIDLPIVF